MNWFTGFMVFIILWWLTWFCALPIGVRPTENPEPGHEPGAPEKTYLWWKVGGTTLKIVTLASSFAANALTIRAVWTPWFEKSNGNRMCLMSGMNDPSSGADRKSTRLNSSHT